jgi:hypothetical protein
MLIHRRSRSAAGLPLFLAAALLFAACERSPTRPQVEPEATEIRLSVGDQTVSVSLTGAVTGGPIRIPVGSTAVAAEFLLASGQPDPVVVDPAFRLDVTSLTPTLVSFQRTGAFAGTLVGVQPGTGQIEVSLYGVSHGHAEIGPFPVAVIVE